jgi:hypothetical protein
MRQTIPGAPVAAPTPDLASADRVRSELELVLASGHFKSSQRCQALLRYLVERTLAGEGAQLKERVIGVEVFGRPSDYDTGDDPVVRTTAGEIRKKLAQFYQEAGPGSAVRIEVHPGSYLPEFRLAEAPVAEAAPPEPGVARRRIRRAYWIAGGLVAASLMAGSLWRFLAVSPVERFWEPMLNAPGGVLFCLGQPRVYNLYSDAKQRDLEQMIQSLPRASLQGSQETIPLKDLVPMWDRYIALGDAMCLLRLASVFEKRGKQFTVRGGGSTSFPDLRERPAVLIGAFDNEWTLHVVGKLRYTFYKDFQGLEVVRDRDHPERSDWKLVNSWPYWEIPNDYAIVSRVWDHTTDRLVVIAAGITHFGTAAAGEFLSDPSYFSDVLPLLPRGWDRQNLQIVLSVPVVHGAGGHPRVLAAYVW